MSSYLFYSLPENLQRKIGWRARAFVGRETIACEKKNHLAFEKSTIIEKKRLIFDAVKDIAVYAARHNTFYKNFYGEQNFDPTKLRSFADLTKIPIVDKDTLRRLSDTWVTNRDQSILGNTGGTSGSPLAFTFHKSKFAKEQYYIDRIFEQMNCRPHHARLVFRGLNELGSESWKYHPRTDAYLINTYKPLHEMIFDLERLFINKNIKFLHGYPSCIYQFCLELRKGDAKYLLDLIRHSIEGVLFGSEYPAPKYRSIIEEVLGAPTISWYGHSEKVVLATESPGSPYIYRPYHTYGWSEAVVQNDGSHRLVGTDYTNRFSPFLRYDTGDHINPVKMNSGLLEAFEIAEGRVGDFVYDASNNAVSLTSLIFGRHHKAFEYFDYIQVFQEAPGKAILLVVPSQGSIDLDLKAMFDLTNVDIQFEIRAVERPFRTAAGKLPLIVPQSHAN